MTTTTNFHEANRASEVLSKIGRGQADADFARAIHEAIDRVTETGKKAKVVTTVTIEPNEERGGGLLLRADIVAKLPMLPSPASQMHVGPAGNLMTQQDFLMGGGRDESPPKPLPIEQAAAANTASGRFKIVVPPVTAPVAAAPAPKPLVGKDAAAGKDQ
jgi:hypothetical protein